MFHCFQIEFFNDLIFFFIISEVFELLIKFHGSPHISSVNLMTCMGSLVLIAKLRPQFIGKVVTALESLHSKFLFSLKLTCCYLLKLIKNFLITVNLPPTLSKSQVSSVRKHLKLQLLNLLRLPASLDFHSNITTLLTDLGATYQEVVKAYPKPEELRKYKQKRQQEQITQSEVPSKKPRLEITVEDTDVEMVEPVEEKKPTVVADTAVDVTERFIAERLTPEIAAQLVMLSMSKLPDIMPPHFSAAYTPIAAAGTKGQIRHVARLMATQFTTANLGPGVKVSKKSTQKITTMEEEDEEPPAYVPTKGPITTVISCAVPDVKKPEEKAKTTTLMPAGAKLSRISRLKTLKLSEITKPLKEEAKNALMVSSVERILNAEKSAAEGGAILTRGKIITNMASTFSPQIRKGLFMQKKIFLA